jgi:hypothetical protein
MTKRVRTFRLGCLASPRETCYAYERLGTFGTGPRSADARLSCCVEQATCPQGLVLPSVAHGEAETRISRSWQPRTGEGRVPVT